jgi:hypothetical protein
MFLLLSGNSESMVTPLSRTNPPSSIYLFFFTGIFSSCCFLSANFNSAMSLIIMHLMAYTTKVSSISPTTTQYAIKKTLLVIPNLLIVLKKLIITMATKLHSMLRNAIIVQHLCWLKSTELTYSFLIHRHLVIVYKLIWPLQISHIE